MRIKKSAAKDAKYLNPFSDFGFRKVFQCAALSELSAAEYEAYESSLKAYRDLKNVVDTARQEGRHELMRSVVQQAKARGLSIKQIIEFTASLIKKFETFFQKLYEMFLFYPL